MLLMLAGVERPVRGEAVDRDQGAVQDHVGMPGLPGVPDRLAELRGAGREQFHGLVHVPPGRGDADTEADGQAGERLAFAQASQDEQRLLAWVQLPPQRPDRLPVAADDSGGEGEGLAGQRQRGTVEKHQEPLAW